MDSLWNNTGAIPELHRMNSVPARPPLRAFLEYASRAGAEFTPTGISSRRRGDEWAQGLNEYASPESSQLVMAGDAMRLSLA